MATNQGFASLVAGDTVLPEFLMYWVQCHRRDFESRAGGSTFPEISRANVAAIPITLPSLAEQRRIVDLIASMDAAISDARSFADATVSLRRTVLGQLLSQEHEIPAAYDALLVDD